MSSRDDLIASLEAYLDALAMPEPLRVAVAPSFRYTENGMEVPLGKGMWRTAKGREPGGLYLADPVSGQAAWFGVMREGEKQTILGTRIKVNDGKVSEAEALVVRDTCILFHPETMSEPRDAFTQDLEPALRTPREEMIETANWYFDGIEQDNGDIIPLAPGTVRWENGYQTTNNPDSERDVGTMGIAAQMNAGFTRHIEAARDRRYLLVDEEKGVVLVHFLFDHPGDLESAGGRVPFGYPNSMMLFEWFKVYGGAIHAIEAILEIFPYGYKSGW